MTKTICPQCEDKEKSLSKKLKNREKIEKATHTTVLLLFALILISFMLFSIADIYKNRGLVRAYCPNDYCSPIPQGMSGIAWTSKYEKGTDEYMIDYCNWLFPKPCNSLD